ncbi:MAG TPA: type IV toxin-antitoxin system AbiEi family antitoxin domain-containing protein [Amnibacterium sp.]
MADHHFFTIAELRARGSTTGSIRREIEAGRLERVIKGWYATPRTDREAVRAMRLGGRLGCISALRLKGAWCPPDQGMHLEFPSYASGRRLAGRGLPADAVAHWHGKEEATGSAFPVVPIDAAVARMLQCQPPQLAIAVLDSLLFRRLMTENRLRAVLAAGPERMRFLADQLEPRSEEGIESIVRFRLAMIGITASVQVTLRSHDRLDLLVDDWLVLELDGRETHAQEKAFTADRVRTARLIRNGRLVLQFAYATILYDWSFVESTVLDVIAKHAPIRARRA